MPQLFNFEIYAVLSIFIDFSSKFYETPYSRQHFAIPEIDFCKYNQTDINYYTVCNHFLTGTWTGLDGKPLKGGLLHDPQGLSVSKKILLA